MKENNDINSDIFIEKKKSKKKKKSEKVKPASNSFNDSDKLEENLEKFAEELKTADEKVPIPVSDVDKKREELVKAAEEGYISQKVEYLKKCGVKVIDKIYKSYEIKRKKDADIFLTDLIISQFSNILGGLDAIENPKVLTDELKENTVMKRDIENAVSVISPYIPLIGILGGIATTGKHIYKHKTAADPKDKVPPAENNDKST